DPVYRDNARAGVPPQQLRAAVLWRCGSRLHLEPELEWLPHRRYIEHDNTFAAPVHILVHLKRVGELELGWEWFADLRNLTDRRWIAATGVIADAGGSDARQFLPGTPRAIYVGVEWRPWLTP